MRRRTVEATGRGARDQIERPFIKNYLRLVICFIIIGLDMYENISCTQLSILELV